MDQISIVKKILEVIMSIFRKVNFHQLIKEGGLLFIARRTNIFLLCLVIYLHIKWLYEVKNMGE